MSRHRRWAAGPVAATVLGPEWEWNHNPDNARWSVNNGLRLQTATEVASALISGGTVTVPRFDMTTP